MTKSFLFAAAIVAANLNVRAADHLLHTFKKIQLSDAFWGDGANFGDFNHDGQNDIVSGPYWYEAPDFKKRHEYMPADATFKRKNVSGAEEAVPGFDPLGYSKNFFAFTYDFNKDGWTDILILGFPGEDTSWYENPKGKDGHWVRHKVLDVTDNESPTFADITGDGKPEVICNSGGYFGYAEPDWNDAAKPWTFHPITPKGGWQRFTHGMGIGDVNGDGRMDLLEKDGWWEQPSSLKGDPAWTKHAVNFGTGGSHMYAYDVDGDGDNDVITSLAAHGYGLAWYENVKDVNGEITFKQHVIMDKEPKDNKYGVAFSQLHAIDLIDMDGDGVKDLVTGKRFWAHGPHGDADPAAPAVLYWFKLVHDKNHNVDFVPHMIDDNSGIGTQVVAGNINKDKWPDVVVGNKKGTFVFMHEVKKAARAEWDAAQPKPVSETK
ncbi:MAG: Cysteine proteinase [Verrucomicrobiales bacterium]|nr:Cysteine proteinase [Verrucomicrobiales bacterium]